MNKENEIVSGEAVGLRLDQNLGFPMTLIMIDLHQIEWSEKGQEGKPIQTVGRVSF